MATLKLGTYSLFLTIILWGTLLGGIAYSHLVYFPVYLCLARFICCSQWNLWSARGMILDNHSPAAYRLLFSLSF